MKKVVSFILILVIIGETFLFALNTQASIQGSTTEFAKCTTGNIVGTYLANKLQDYVNRKAKDFAKELIKRELARRAAGLITVPTLDNFAINAIGAVQGAVNSNTDQFFNKAYVTDVIARCAARTILNAMVGNIFTVMRTNGRDGGVTFVKNWVNFQLQAQYRGENIFRAELSTAQLCDYLADDIKKSFGVDPKKNTPITKQQTRSDSLQPFSLSAKCTMPIGFTPQKYQQDFAGNGGWDAFSRMLEPQNNAWGLTALSQNEIAKQRALSVSADTNQALAGNGYLGTSGRGKSESCAVKSPNGADCIVYNDIKTTGSYIAANIAASINSELAWITSAQGLGSIIANLTEVLLNRLLDQGNPDEGKPRVADETGGVDPGDIIPTDTPTPIPSVPPAPPPAPESLLADVEAERAKYGTPMTPTEIGQLLNAVAWKNKDNGWVLLGKSSGDNCPAPIGIPISCDYLVYQPTLSGYDVLSDQEGAGIPTWNGPDPYIPGMLMDGSRTLVPPIQPGNGGGGVCADPGNTTANYTAQLSAAETAVLSNNSTLADSLNSTANSTAFVGAVVTQLRSSGLQASGSVKSGNGAIHTDNLVAVWQSGDTVIERYEAVNHAGDEDMTIRNASQAEYSGDIPMSCAN